MAWRWKCEAIAASSVRVASLGDSAVGRSEANIRSVELGAIGASRVVNAVGPAPVAQLADARAAPSRRRERVDMGMPVANALRGQTIWRPRCRAAVAP